MIRRFEIQVKAGFCEPNKREWAAAGRNQAHNTILSATS